MNAQNTSALTPPQQGIVAVSALTATGDLEQLKTEIHSALDNGVTINEIKEILSQLYAYCGFPRSLNATNVLMNVLEERKSKGITDKEGKKIAVENNVDDKYEQGRKVLEELTKTPQTKPAPGFGAFVPRTDAFLKEHLFADIFASDVLSFQQRELATISALAAMEGVEPQLKSHIGMGKNTGIMDEQLKQVAQIIEEKINRTQANILRRTIGVAEVPVIEKDILVRIAEVEVYPQYLQEYLSFAKTVGETSVKTEPGVISVFPMQTKENPKLIRIVEIYKDKKAYDAHIASEHFQHYKTSTPHMIKSLKLVDMN